MTQRRRSLRQNTSALTETVQESDVDWAPLLPSLWEESRGEEFRPRTWSGWRGAYRIVTDGFDVVAEDEEAVAPDHGRGHPALIAEFRLAHPERGEVRLVSGWLIMTANETGFGLLAYDAEGFELEQARLACEAWIGKPVHPVPTSGLSDQVWQDPMRYAIYPEGGEMVGFLSSGSSNAEE